MAIYSKIENMYIALSNEVSNSVLAGGAVLGAKVFLADTGLWYVIQEDGTLAAYEQPVTLNGSITIGQVEGLGVAGTPSGGVLTVQGVASATPVFVKTSATSVSPSGQASTSSYALVVGSTLDTLNNQFVSYTIQNTGAGSIDWEVQGGNASDLSDGVVVNTPASILANAYDSYAGNALYRYYGVFIQDTVGGVHGVGTVKGITKG